MESFSFFPGIESTSRGQKKEKDYYESHCNMKLQGNGSLLVVSYFFGSRYNGVGPKPPNKIYGSRVNTLPFLNYEKSNTKV